MPVNEDVCMHAWVARQTLYMMLAKLTFIIWLSCQHSKANFEFKFNLTCVFMIKIILNLGTIFC